MKKVLMSTVKEALPCILPVLTDLINRSLQSSIFPSAWKISEVVPLVNLVKEGPEIMKSQVITDLYRYFLQCPKFLSE